MGLTVLFHEDTRPNKVNLGIGAYKSEDGEVVLFQSVHEAERYLWEEKRSKSYLPIDGDIVFKEEILKLIYGQYDPKTHFCAHTAGCTAALKVSGNILTSMGIQTIYLPDLTWQNHYLLYSMSGLKTETYPYFDLEKKTLRLTEILEVLKNAPENSAVLMQVGCHNPVGRDPNEEEWEAITNLIAEKNLFPILDCAYQGFGDGFTEDAYPIRLYSSKFSQYFLCYSFSKNFGLYGERVGAFFGIDKTGQFIDKLRDNTKHFIRGAYSSPGIHGSRIIKTILQSSELKASWEEELSEMQKRLRSLRCHFVEKLKASGISRNYDYIQKDKGLFSLMGLSKEQVIKLRENFGVYIVENSRINIAALSMANLDYVVDAIKQILN
ncbi:MAG: Aspartate aminotransferase [Chlamydiae bacterium]|nr:Aspartate aminotransferase [Chlamydiota bacterium]